MPPLPWFVLTLLAFVLAACAGGSQLALAPTALPSPTASALPIAAPTATAPPAGIPTPSLLPPEPPPSGAAREFKTDFSRHTVPYTEILSGGPPKDGIPAIDTPAFISVGEADAWLQDQEPVILVQVGEDARAYPLQILIWHEIVNDTVGGKALTVTFCPLCNTAIVFERTVDGQVLDFGTTGRLRYSNLVMYDRQTESWWQQAGGDAIAGEMAGRRLAFYPAAIVAWADFRSAYPAGRVLSNETGFLRDYGRNPYVGYDDVDQPPWLYQGPATPGQMPPMARVLTVDGGSEAVAYPYDALQTAGVVNDAVAGKPVVVFWVAGTASALDDFAVAGGRDVGAANAFSAELDGRRLSFRRQGDRILDEQTGSEWDGLGRAVGGELAGSRLESLVSVNHFWFSWAAFRPDTRIYQP